TSRIPPRRPPVDQRQNPENRRCDHVASGVGVGHGRRSPAESNSPSKATSVTHFASPTAGSRQSALRRPPLPRAVAAPLARHGCLRCPPPPRRPPFGLALWRGRAAGGGGPPQPPNADRRIHAPARGIPAARPFG